MKYRIVLYNNLYYPQVKRLFFWKYFKVLKKHPYGDPYIVKESFQDMGNAVAFIEQHGANLKSKAIYVVKQEVGEDWDMWSGLGWGLATGILILFILLLLKKFGMV